MVEGAITSIHEEQEHGWTKCSDALYQEVGIPQTVVTDNAPEKSTGSLGRSVANFEFGKSKQFLTVHGRTWRSQRFELKVGIRRTLRRSKAPRRLWCFCDISQYAQFDWYEPVLYWDPVGTFPHEQKLLGRWLGVAEVSTDLMAFYLLTKTGKIIVRKSVWGLSEDDFANPDIKTRLVELDEGIRSKIGDDLKELRGSMPETSDDVFDDEDEGCNDPGDTPSPDEGTDDHTPESYDEYLTAQVLLPQGGEAKKATVVGRKRDHDGRPIGKRHANPLLDTCLYEVEFPDGLTEAILRLT
ncbi:Reverse transcriptase (RNA-dependent DNA polymerase) [Fragilaria crotonensis]|nr:Reverse transcriptase (RNA-dependent DNA polymerase) [Fragilaria crotonensis]